MKERFYKFIPITLIVINSAIWLLAFLLYNNMQGLYKVLFIYTMQTILLFYCGNVIYKLYCQSIRDSLTNIYNRRYFLSKMASFPEVEYPISLMMIDIDDFKRINDTYGHLAGDEFLKQFADILVNNIRSTDMVARFGGEEFVVVLPKTCCKDAYIIAERIKAVIETNIFRFDSIAYNMTISIGISTSDYTVNTDCLFKNADSALYKAKETKNSVVTYEQIKAFST